MTRYFILLGVCIGNARGGVRTALARGWPKRWVPEGERGSNKEHVFNEWIMGFNCCTFRSGLELPFVPLSRVVTIRLVCLSPISWLVLSVRISEAKQEHSQKYCKLSLYTYATALHFPT